MAIDGQSDEKEEQDDWRYRRWKKVGKKREGPENEQEPDLEQPRHKRTSWSDRSCKFYSNRNPKVWGIRCQNHSVSARSSANTSGAGNAGPSRRRSGEVTLRRRHTTNVSKTPGSELPPTGDSTQTAALLKRIEQAKLLLQDYHSPSVDATKLERISRGATRNGNGTAGPSRWQSHEATRRSQTSLSSSGTDGSESGTTEYPITLEVQPEQNEGDDTSADENRKASPDSDELSPVPSDITRDEDGNFNPFWRQRRANKIRFQAEGFDEERRIEDPSQPDILRGLYRNDESSTLAANSDDVPAALQVRDGSPRWWYGDVEEEKPQQEKEEEESESGNESEMDKDEDEAGDENEEHVDDEDQEEGKEDEQHVDGTPGHEAQEQGEDRDRDQNRQGDSSEVSSGADEDSAYHTTASEDEDENVDEPKGQKVPQCLFGREDEGVQSTPGGTLPVQALDENQEGKNERKGASDLFVCEAKDDADHTTSLEDQDEDEVESPTSAATSVGTEIWNADTPSHHRAPRSKDPTVHERDLRLVRAYGTANGRLAFDAVLKIRLMRALEQVRQPASRDQYQEAYKCANSAVDLTRLALEIAAGPQDVDHLSKVAGQAHYYAGLAAHLAGPQGSERALEHLYSSIEYTRDHDVKVRSRAEEVINNIMQYQSDPNRINADSTDQVGSKATSLWAKVRGTFGSIASTFWGSSPYDRGVMPMGDRLNSEMFYGEVSPGQTRSIRSLSAIGSSTKGKGGWRDSIRSALAPIPGLGLEFDLGRGAGLYSAGPLTRSSSNSDRTIPEVVPVNKRMTISIGSSNSSRTFGRTRPTPQRNKTAPSSFGITQSPSVKIGAARSDRNLSNSVSAVISATGCQPGFYNETLSGPSSSLRSIASGQSNGKQLIPRARLAPLPDTIIEEREDAFVAGVHGPKVVKKFSNTLFIEPFEPPGQLPPLPNPQGPHLPWPDLPYEGYVPPNEAHPDYQGPWLIGYHDGQQWVESEADGEPIWRYYTDVKVKRLVEEGPGQKDKNSDYDDDGLKWNEENPWTVYHPMQRSPRKGDKVPPLEEPEDYPQGFYEAGFPNARYAEPYAKRDWQMSDFVLPVQGMGLGPDDVEGQRGEDRAEDEAIRNTGLWQQKVRMARKVVGPKVDQMVKEFARSTMKVMLETLTVEEMYEYCLDMNQAALKRKVWEILCDNQAREQGPDRLPAMPPAPRLKKAQLAVVKKSPTSPQIPPTPRLAKARLAVVKSSPNSPQRPPDSPPAPSGLIVVNASPQNYVDTSYTPSSSSSIEAEQAGTIVSPRESEQAASAPRSPKAKLAVVNVPAKDQVTPPQLPRYQETPEAPKAKRTKKHVSPPWSPIIPLSGVSSSVFSSPERTSSGRPKSITWNLPPLTDKHELPYRVNSSPISPLAYKNAVGSPHSWASQPSPVTSSGASSTSTYIPKESTPSPVHKHRRKSSIIQDTPRILTGAEPAISPEDAAERGESPSASPAVDTLAQRDSKKNWRQSRLSFPPLKQYKMLEELLEEGHSPGLKPDGFGEEKTVTF